MKLVRLTGATALASLAGFDLTCRCYLFARLDLTYVFLVPYAFFFHYLCLFSTIMGLPPLFLAPLRCFAFTRACSPFSVPVIMVLISLHGKLGVKKKPTGNCSIELSNISGND